MRARKSKKGFEVSVSFIVILIMTLVIFSSSIFILNKFRTQTDEIGGTLTLEAQQSIQNQLTAGQVVALVPSTVTLTLGKSTVSGIGIVNTGVKRPFYVVIAGTKGFKEDDPDELIDPVPDLTDSLDSWVLYDNGAREVVKDAPYWLEKAEHTVVSVNIKPKFQIGSENAPTPRGTYLFNVCVLIPSEAQASINKNNIDSTPPEPPSTKTSSLRNTCRKQNAGNLLGTSLYTGKVYKLQIVVQ